MIRLRSWEPAARIFVFSWKYIRDCVGKTEYMTACQYASSKVIRELVGHSWENLFRYTMAIASREKSYSQGHSGPTEAFYKHCGQCWSLAILKWGPVGQTITLVGAALPKGAKVWWQCSLQSYQCRGLKNLLGVRGAKMDGVKFWHVNKGSPSCWGWKIHSFLAIVTHLLGTT